MGITCIGQMLLPSIKFISSFDVMKLSDSIVLEVSLASRDYQVNNQQNLSIAPTLCMSVLSKMATVLLRHFMCHVSLYAENNA